MSSTIDEPLAENGLRDKRFSADHRIRKSSEFKTIYQQGKKIITPVIIFFLCRREPKEARLGLTVSKKFGKAVRRNRIKRYIREAFREVHSDLEHIDIVANPRRGASDQPFEAYLKSFRILARQLRVKAQEEKDPT